MNRMKNTVGDWVLFALIAAGVLFWMWLVLWPTGKW